MPMQLPSELTEFVPEKVTFGTSSPFPTWELKANEFSDSIEIRNVIFSWTAIITIIVLVAFITLICGIIMAAAIADPPGGLSKEFFVVKVSLIWLFGIGIFVAIMLWETYSNTSLWKGGLRFQYDKTSGGLFFPRENVRYARDDYDTLILGVTEGYNTVLIAEHMEKFGGKTGRVDLVIQAYFLVRHKDGAWARHLIVYNLFHSKSIQRAIIQVQKTMRCSMAKRQMTLPECYATQHKSVTETKPRAPLYITYYCYVMRSFRNVNLTTASYLPSQAVISEWE